MECREACVLVEDRTATSGILPILFRCHTYYTVKSATTAEKFEVFAFELDADG